MNFSCRVSFWQLGEREKGNKEKFEKHKCQKGLQCNLLENILKFNTVLKLSENIKPSPAQSHSSTALGQSLHAGDKSLSDNLFWTSLSLILVYVPFPLAAQLFKSPFWARACGNFSFLFHCNSSKHHKGKFNKHLNLYCFLFIILQAPAAAEI